MKLLIRNLSRSTTESELLQMFQEFGTVQSCILVTDAATRASKGFGFVVMPSPGDAKAAMKTLNGSEVRGARIRVKKASKKPAPDTKSEPQAEQRETPKAPARRRAPFPKPRTSPKPGTKF